MVITGLTIGTVVTYDEQEVSLPLGIAATVVGAVMIPIVAAGGASARTGPGQEGLPTLRQTSWWGYGLALADAAVLIGLSFAESAASAGVAASVGALGTASAVGMSLDAFESASQARRSVPTSAQTTPAFYVTRVPGNGLVMGLGGAF